MTTEEVNWQPKNYKDLPSWAHGQTQEENEAFTRWLDKHDGDPFEPTARNVLLYWAEIRGIEVPPWRPEPATLPGMLSEAFMVNGTINIGSGYFLWWLVSRDNYEPEDAKRLIEDSGLQIRDDALGTMVDFHRKVLRLEPSKEVRSFDDFVSEGLLPRGALVIAVHRVI
jgi:hypothetical protein